MSEAPHAYPPLRILVTAWRHWPETQKHVIEEALRLARIGVLPSIGIRNSAHINPVRPYWFERRLVVVHGQCPDGGGDRWAEEWAVKYGHAVERHPAHWKAQGRQAGPLRNGRMVRDGADLCLAFPGHSSRGTWDCVRAAARAGIEVVVIGAPFEVGASYSQTFDWPDLPQVRIVNG